MTKTSKPRVTKRPTAPHSIFSEELWKRFLALVEEGKTVREIPQIDGMPAWDTLRRWMRQDEELSSQYAHARTKAADAFEAEIIERARSANPEDAAAARLHVDTLKWIMARRAPKVYGDKITQEHTGPNGDALAAPTLILQTMDAPKRDKDAD